MSVSHDPLFVEDEIPIRDEIVRVADTLCIRSSTTSLEPLSNKARCYNNSYLEYDRAGVRVRHEKFDHLGRLMRRWLYNPEGTLIQEITLNASGGVEYRFDIVNNSSSWTEKRMYLPPDILQYRIIADRDANSRLVRAIYLNSKGDQLRVDVYHYDKSGMLTRVDMANMGESLYEYDHNRDLRRKTINMPGASAHGDIHEFTYDERRLLIRDDYLKRSTTTFQYTLRR